MQKENDVLEKTLALAEEGYLKAYCFLQNEYENNTGNYGPQTFYFLACLAGGADMPQKALEWLKQAIDDHGWWYRPEVLEDDDLAGIKDDPAFLSLKAVSDQRYTEMVSKTKEVFSWKRKSADNLFLAVHGNTQNGQMAKADWEPIVGENPQWQLETIQSAEPDGYGTYRWSYDMTSYLPVARAMEKIRQEGYEKIACGGFSAGCDMLLRSILFTSVRCDVLILQSPWIPILEERAEDLVNIIKEKKIEIILLCGSEDEDCLPMAKTFYAMISEKELPARLVIQPDNRHQFPRM